MKPSDPIFISILCVILGSDGDDGRDVRLHRWTVHFFHEYMASSDVIMKEKVKDDDAMNGRSEVHHGLLCLFFCHADGGGKNVNKDKPRRL